MPDWCVHLLHLLRRSLGSGLGWMGTTTLAVFVGLANEYLKPWAKVWLARRSGETIGRPPRRDFAASALITVATWIILFWVGVITTVYTDHQGLVAKNMSLLRVQSENEQLNRRVKELTPAEESADSLRRRTIRLADELYSFLRERQQHHPPFAYPDSRDPNPSEERRQAIKLCQEYDQVTIDRFRRLYRDRMVGIVREYHSKGIPVGFLENDAKQQIPGWSIVGTDWEGSPVDDLTLFRNLAYRVDASDNPIYITPHKEP